MQKKKGIEIQLAKSPRVLNLYRKKVFQAFFAKRNKRLVSGSAIQVIDGTALLSGERMDLTGKQLKGLSKS